MKLIYPLTKSCIPVYLFLLMSCSSINRSVDIVNIPEQKWRITSVKISGSENVWLVSGILRSPNIFGMPNGAIDISIIAENGTAIETKTINYQRLTNSGVRQRKHQYGTALFSTSFKTIPDTARVKVKLILQPDT